MSNLEGIFLSLALSGSGRPLFCSNRLYQHSMMTNLGWIKRVIFCFLHVVNPDPDGDEGEDVVGLVVLHPKHEHDAKSGAKSENAREHSGSKEVETNL